MERKRRRIKIEKVINKRKFITDPKQIINQLHKRKGVNKVALSKAQKLYEQQRHQEILRLLSERVDLNNDYAKAKEEFETIEKANKEREVRKAQDYRLKMLLEELYEPFYVYKTK